jgi:hypothetical protein
MKCKFCRYKSFNTATEKSMEKIIRHMVEKHRDKVMYVEGIWIPSGDRKEVSLLDFIKKEKEKS